MKKYRYRKKLACKCPECGFKNAMFGKTCVHLVEIYIQGGYTGKKGNKYLFIFIKEVNSGYKI